MTFYNDIYEHSVHSNEGVLWNSDGPDARALAHAYRSSRSSTSWAHPRHGNSWSAGGDVGQVGSCNHQLRCGIVHSEEDMGILSSTSDHQKNQSGLACIPNLHIRSPESSGQRYHGQHGRCRKGGIFPGTLHPICRSPRSCWTILSWGSAPQWVECLDLTTVGVTPPQRGVVLRLGCNTVKTVGQQIAAFAMKRPIRKAGDLSRPVH